jgi:hypothetical protein
MGNAATHADKRKGIKTGIRLYLFIYLKKEKYFEIG